MKKLGRPRFPRAICPMCRTNPIEHLRNKYCSRACSNRSRLIPMADRFELYFHPGEPDACWPWTGTIHHAGYGVIGDENRRQRQAHQVSYERAYGPIPAGLWVLHRCDNPPCVNPAHLFLGTHDDNMADRSQKRRQPHGENHPKAKLTEADVRTIRATYRGRGCGPSQQAIADQYGINQSVISDIVLGNYWKYVQ